MIRNNGKRSRLSACALCIRGLLHLLPKCMSGNPFFPSSPLQRTSEGVGNPQAELREGVLSELWCGCCKREESESGGIESSKQSHEQVASRQSRDK